MIAQLKGTLAYKSHEFAIVDVNGIGYRVYIPLSTFYQLPEIYQPVFLNTYTYVRENALKLYGFYTTEEKALFELLIGTSGIGPSLARNILSGISADDLYEALHKGDSVRLNRIPGIGLKTSQRLVVELKDKVKTVCGELHSKKVGDEKSDLLADVASALQNLGYKKGESEKAADAIKDLIDTETNFEKAFKEAMKVLIR
ncbi:MAG: Holliday junction branch migration protein RuvA [Thermodesulfobacteriota bacterium]